MSTIEEHRHDMTTKPTTRTVDMRLEVVSGPDPQRRSSASFVTFSDPDGDSWVLQEITTRFPGRIDPKETSFASDPDLAAAMRRASINHGEHEARTGRADADGPDRYASYMVAEQSGREVPT